MAKYARWLAVVRLYFVGLAAIIVTVFITASGAPPAVADCNPGQPDNYQTFYHAGRYRTPGGNVTGIYGQLESKSAYAARSSGTLRFTSAAVMLSQWPYFLFPDEYHYYSTGWIKHYGYSGAGDRSYFVQYMDRNNGAVVYTYPKGYGWAPPLGSRNYYTVLYNNYAQYYISFYLDGQLRYYYLTSHPQLNEGSARATINTQSYQMAGTLNWPQSYDDLHIWYNGAWRLIGGNNNFSSDWSRFYAILGGDASVITEDARCND